jgi:2-polyprenyl-3-methyl-5-hydroxy-6-metoxy-1,4-benzoquinol methylase
MDVSKTNPVRALREIPYPNHYGVVADVYTLPFPPDTFDCIIASEVMEHVPDPALFVRQLLHVLQPGGTLIITTPYREDRRFSLCVHCNRPTPLHAHLHVFDETSIRRLMNEGSARSVQLRIFSNKALARLQTHVLLQCLPFGAWQCVDRLANQLYPYPTRLMMNIQKA